MQISKIEIENFRNFKKVSFPTNPKIVIIGENKSGKSNLIYALRLILDDSLPDTKRHLDKYDFNFSISEPVENGYEITISIELTNFSDDEELLSILCDYLISTDCAKITYKFLPKNEIFEQKKKNNEKLNIDDYMYYFYGGNNPLNIIYKNEFLSILRMRVLNAIRDVENDLSLWNKSPLKNLITNDEIINQNKLSEQLQIIQDGITKSTNSFKDSEIITLLQNNIDEYLKNVAGLSSIKTNLSIEGNNDANDILKIIKVFSGNTDESLHSLSQESLGLNNLLYYSLFMLSEMPYKSIVAIEEPESHLHPHLQRMIFKHSMGNNPLILTTHSQNLVNTISNIKDIVILKNKNINFSTVSSLSNLDLSEFEVKNIQRYLDVNRSEMLFAKGVILVEGIAEEYLIPQFAKQLWGNDIDQLGISVCSVNGTYFGDFVKLLNFIKIPFVVITDGDKTVTKDFEDNDINIYAGIIRGLHILDIIRKDFIQNIINKYIDYVPELILSNGNITTDNNKIQKGIKIIQKNKVNLFNRILNYNDIFVNKSTLEQELLETGYTDCFIDIISNYVTEHKKEDIKENIKNKNYKFVVENIEKIGKGRFAQELSLFIQNDKIPNYIEKALNKIKSKVLKDG